MAMDFEGTLFNPVQMLLIEDAAFFCEPLHGWLVYIYF